MQKKMAVEDKKKSILHKTLIHAVEHHSRRENRSRVHFIFLMLPLSRFFKKISLQITTTNITRYYFSLFHFYSDLLDDHLGTRAWPNETHFEYKVISHHNTFTFVCWLSGAAVCIQKIHIYFLNIPKNSRFLMENDDKEDKEVGRVVVAASQVRSHLNPPLSFSLSTS